LLAIALLFTLACGGGGGGGTTRTPDSNNTLNVEVTGSGAVTSAPAGINCGNDCTQDYSSTTQVTLTASPDTGSIFNGWEGACSGTGSCVVAMNSNRSVRANFIESSNSTFILTVTVNGSGRVTSSPSGIDCESDCTESYSSNTSVSLTATPDQGFVLDHWEGACNGNRNCTITLNEAKNITAIFAVEGQQSVLIENYSAPNDAFQLTDIPNNASGITWHAALQQYLVVQNNAATIYRYDVNFAFMGQFRVNNINTDTEGLAYIDNNELLIVSESNVASKILVEENTDRVDGSVPESQQYRILPPGPSNKGLEGIAVKKATSTMSARVYACQEGTSGSNMRIAYFDLPEDSNVLFDYETNLTVVEPFDADQTFEGVARDLAGMVYDERTDHLIIVSQESRKAMQVNPENGAIISELELTGAPQFEGVTFGPNDELVFVSEGNWIKVYTEN